jgi:thiamine-phosphate pyrophosphorylase
VSRLELAQQLRTLCSRYRASLLINDRVDIALAAAADGVHLPGTSFTPAVARQLLGLDALIGASAHSLSEARAAADSGADFLVFGPVFDTPSKRSFGPPLGLAALAEVTRAVSVPVLAIGGINAERCRSVRQCGAHGVALIREILEAVDPRAAARAVRAALG